MLIAKNKTIATLIALFLIVSMAGTTFLILPSANALTHIESSTYAFVTVSPDPVGLGQTMTVMYWLIEMNPLSAANQNNVWHNFTLTITKPDGTTETKITDANSAAGSVINYVPTQLGNYTFKFTFPGEQITSSTVDTYYKSSTATTTCTVQQEPIGELLQNPIPNDYWQRPIQWSNQQWYTISGNWFGNIELWNNWEPVIGSNPNQGYNPDTTAPATAHIVWTKPIAFGGQIGGTLFSANDLSNYYSGKSYEEFFSPPVIIQGVVYYNNPMGIQPYRGVNAVDLRTGDEIWYKNITKINFGEVFSHHNPNEVGGIPYLWQVAGTTYSLYDANTGEWIEDITGVSGTPVMGPEGELLVYRMQTINSTHGFLSMFNATRAIGANGFASNQWQYRPQLGSTNDVSKGIQFNVTVQIFPQTGTSVSIQCINDGVVMIWGTKTVQDYQCEAGYDALTGNLLWHTNRTTGMTQETTACTFGPVSDGVYTLHNKEAQTFTGFDIHTGTQLWGPTTIDTNAWNSFTRLGAADASTVYFVGPGSCRAYDLHTGEFKWVYTPPPAGLESASPTYLFEGMYTVPLGGGEIFLCATNSHGDQLFRGARMYVVNSTTGKLDWSIMGFYEQGHGGGAAIADGYYITFNGYDNQIYTFGKGLTATTVQAPLTSIPLGQSLTLMGTVTDQSPGKTCLGIPAAGTPAIADDSMSPWMEYLYMQQQKPSNATGVPISLDTVDPNGNFVHIGDVTSDSSGMYKFMWTPEISGAYTVIASFAGSKSYFSSTSETAVTVSEAAPTASPYPIVALPPIETYIVAGVIAIIIAIAIVGLLILRKRP
jgi:PQQ-like domain